MPNATLAACTRMNTLCQTTHGEKPPLYELMIQALETASLCYKTTDDVACGLLVWKWTKIHITNAELDSCDWKIPRFRLNEAEAGMEFPFMYEKVQLVWSKFKKFEDQRTEELYGEGARSFVSPMEGRDGWGQYWSMYVYIQWAVAVLFCKDSIHGASYQNLFDHARKLMREHCVFLNSAPTLVKKLITDQRELRAYIKLRELKVRPDAFQFDDEEDPHGGGDTFTWYEDDEGDEGAIRLIVDILRDLFIPVVMSARGNLTKLQKWRQDLPDEKQAIKLEFQFLEMLQVPVTAKDQANRDRRAERLRKKKEKDEEAAAATSTTAATGATVNPSGNTTATGTTTAATSTTATGTITGTTTHPSSGDSTTATDPTTANPSGDDTTATTETTAGAPGENRNTTATTTTAATSTTATGTTAGTTPPHLQEPQQTRKRSRLTNDASMTKEEKQQILKERKQRMIGLTKENWHKEDQLQKAYNFVDLTIIEEEMDNRQSKVREALFTSAAAAAPSGRRETRSNNAPRPAGIVSAQAPRQNPRKPEVRTVKDILILKPSKHWADIAAVKFDLAGSLAMVLAAEPYSIDVLAPKAMSTTNRHKCCVRAALKLGLIGPVTVPVGENKTYNVRDRTYLEACAESWLPSLGAETFIPVMAQLEAQLGVYSLELDQIQDNYLLAVSAARKHPKFKAEERDMVVRMIEAMTGKISALDH